MNMIKKFLFIFFIFSLFIYSFFIEPNKLIVTNYSIKDSQLKDLKVVLVGDFHIKPNQQKRLEKVVSLINNQKPDIVLSVGDFVAGHEENSTMLIDKIASELKKVESKYGFYTVLGNHDWWINGEEMAEVLNKNNIKVLANTNAKINANGKIIYIAGVEDLTTRKPNIYQALNNANQPIILLTHSPDIFPKVPKNVNLTLAGHVHGGQVRLPLLGAIVAPSKYRDKYSLGLIEENNKKMIVTKGIGNSILPVRFNCAPEIVVIDFE